MKMLVERIHNTNEGSGTLGPDSIPDILTAPTNNSDRINQLLPKLQAAKGNVAFVYPGQGSQFLNMGLDLYRHEPVFTAAIDECAGYINSWLNEDIRAVIYPDVNLTAALGKLNNTYYTQAAISAVSYALTRLWMSKGIYPSLLMGHSIGEFMAAHFAGIYSLRDALYLITMRGKIMAALPKGSMLAVKASQKHIVNLLPAHISLAAINTHESCVVAGQFEDIAHFSNELSDLGIASRLLKTSHAFHSFMMEPVVTKFEELALHVTRYKPAISIISTVTGKMLTDHEALDASYWAKNIICPVRFAPAVDTLLSTNAQIILEVGPGSVTSRMVQHISDNSATTIYTLEY